MPHSARDLGLFAPEEEAQPDTLSHFEHWWARPVQIVLLLFGLTYAGVPFEQIGNGTYYVLAALLLGKPVRIVLFSYGVRLAGARLPDGLVPSGVVVVGIGAAIGFTVALFYATAAFPAGPLLAEAKVGALLSFAAAPLALLTVTTAQKATGLTALNVRAGVHLSCASAPVARDWLIPPVEGPYAAGPARGWKSHPRARKSGFFEGFGGQKAGENNASGTVVSGGCKTDSCGGRKSDSRRSFLTAG